MMSREAPAVGLAPLRSRQVESYRFRCEQSCCQGRRGPLGPNKQDKRNQSQEATKAVCSFSSAPRQGPRGAAGTSSPYWNEQIVTSEADGPLISLMLAVSDAPTAADWYKRAMGATELWNLGTVVGLEVEGTPFFLAQPANNGWDSPSAIGTTTVRIEVFVDDPDSFVERAIEAGADGTLDRVRDHEAPWGKHRQGGFYDPFGHLWLVGDKSPLERFP